MGPARAYLLPMMKPNTMNTRIMVPATATTAMMMTGFCSLETIAADETDTHKHTQTDMQKDRNAQCELQNMKDFNLQGIIEPMSGVEIDNPPPLFPSERVASIFELSLYTRLYCFRKWA